MLPKLLLSLIQWLIGGLFLQDRKKKTQSWMHVRMDCKLRDDKTTLISLTPLHKSWHFTPLCSPHSHLLLWPLLPVRQTIPVDLSSHLWKTLILIEWKHIKQVPFHLRDFSLNYGNAERRNRKPGLLVFIYQLFRKGGAHFLSIALEKAH